MFKYVAHLLRAWARNGNAGVIARLATKADYEAFEAWLRDARSSIQPSDRASKMLAEVEQTGICVIPGYWTAEQCAEARSEVDRIIGQYPEYVHPHAKADRRVYGADKASDVIARFNKDPDLASVASAYNHEPTVAPFTLAARMPYMDGNSGSGEGWHRDAFLRQFKAIIYLSDAGPDNGPFQMIRDSHRRSHILHDMKAASLSYKQNRLDDQHVAKLVNEAPERLLTFTGLAGTLILVDTSTIHRGMPIKAGTRYALTNYYYPESRIDQAMYEKFKVLPAA